jgi:hypothetical protein
MRTLLSVIVKRILLASIVIAAASSSARAERVKVAIVPSVAVNLNTARVDALAQALADALVAELDIDAVGGLEVRRRLPVDGIAPDCATTPSCATDVARRLDVTQLLFVVMVDSGAGGAVQVDSTWVEPSTGHTAARAAIDLTSTADADAKSKFAAAARSLLPDAPVRPKKAAQNLVNRDRVPRHFTVRSKLTTVVGGAALITGVVLWVETRDAYNSCQADIACSMSGPNKRKDNIRALGLGADAGFLVATGCAIATTIMYVTSGEVPHVIVAPSPGGVSIAAVGRF